MSRIFGFSLILLTLGLPFSDAQASVTSARARTQQRFKHQCDDDGNGKACYDYGRALWAEGGGASRRLAKKYLLRGCELKYHYSCEAYHEHNTSSQRSGRHPKELPASNGPIGPCYNNNDLETARFYPNMISATSVHGQLIGNIQPKSFWGRAGFQEGDVIIRINNQPFNDGKKVLNALSTAGKKFSFQVERNHETITLWYTCT